MPSQVEPLINVKEHESFLEDQAAVERALAHARRFARPEPLKDRNEAGEAADAIKALGNVRRDAEERKKGITAPWRLSTTAANTEYKELLAPIAAAEEALKQKGLAFKRSEEARIAEEHRQREEQQNREAEEKIQEAQEAAELAAEDDDEELKTLADEKRQEAAAAAAAPPPRAEPAPRQVRGGFSSLGTRTVYKHEVVDAALVPERNKVVSDASLKADIAAEKAAAKAENRPFNLDLIPGVRIFTEEIPVSR